MQAEVTTLGSGLRVVTEAVPSVRSVALGIWVRNGSRDEALGEAGLSHFLEHLLFKGTAEHSAIEISELFDGMGASVNAATGKEATHLHARLLDGHLEEAFELMSEMFLRPTFPDIDSERQVVLEEIAMYEDEPSDRVHDHLSEAIFGSSPLGRRVLGSADVISSTPVDSIAEFHSARYRPQQIVVSAAGSLDHATVVGLAERLMGSDARSDETLSRPDGDAEVNEPRIEFHPKDTEQYHVCLGTQSLSRGDERRYEMAVLDTVLGGSTSSRLFREVREKRGLAYAVGSYQESYVDTGLSGIYVGTREENLSDACGLIAKELRSLAEGSLNDDELARAKESVKGRLVLSAESTAVRMSRNARSALFDLPLETLDEMIDAVDAVSGKGVTDLAAELFGREMSVAAIGRSREAFDSALAEAGGAAVA